MKIALIGYGKMGKIIEEIALDRGHEVTLKINSSNQNDLSKDKLSLADVAIEFTNPKSAVANIKSCLEANVPVAIGTTGWYNQYTEIESICKQHNGTFLSATNFSVGVNIFFELNRRLAELMSKRSNYTAEVQEIHHTEKLDSPSGTAISLAEGIIETHNQYTNWNILNV